MRAVGSSGAGGRAPSLRCHHMRAPRSALPCSAPVVQFKQSGCGLFEGHVVSGFIGHAACAPPKKSFPDQLKNTFPFFYFHSILPGCLKSTLQLQSLLAKLRYESSTLILYKELSSPIFHL